MVTANGIKILVNELPRPPEDSNGSEGRERDDAVTANDIKQRCKDDLAILPHLGSDPVAANIHGPEDRFRCGDCGGSVEKIACDSGYAGYFGCEGCDWVGEPSLPPPTKGKGKKGGTAGQQRARR